MKNKKNVILGVGYVLVATIFFFIGSNVSNHKPQTGNNMNQFAQGGQFGQNRGGRMMNGNVFGQIIAKDSNSITVEMKSSGPNEKNPENQNNNQTGSKIVFYTDQTTVIKSMSGKLSDLLVGQNISINGNPNSDGSINADSIQIR